MRAHSFRIALLAAGAALALTSCMTPKSTAEEGIWVKTKESAKMTQIIQGDKDHQERVAMLDELNYVLDEQGNIECVYEELDGLSYSSKSRYTYTRDDNGFMMSKKHSTRSTTPEHEDVPLETEYSYERDLDDAGRVTRYTAHLRSPDAGTTELWIECTYDSSGKLTSYASTYAMPGNSDDEASTAQDEATTQTEAYYFDERGLNTKIVSKATSATEGKESATSVETSDQTWELDEDGRPTKSTLTSDKEGVIETTSYVYDSNGNLASSSFERKSEQKNSIVRCESTYEWTYIEHPSPAARAAASIFNSSVEL